VRRLPDVLSSREGLQNESFSDGMNGILEHPQYTKPRVWRELEVPEILISGHHENIKKWKKQQSIEKTRKNRSDLLDNIN